MQILKFPDIIIVLIIISTLIVSGLFYFTQPEGTVTIMHELNSQYVGDMGGYTDILIIEASEIYYDENIGVYSTDRDIYYFPGENKTRDDLNPGDIIDITWKLSKMNIPTKIISVDKSDATIQKNK